jgi:prepilin-type N-terminal cleavage/methylation domain-containing protein
VPSCLSSPAFTLIELMLAVLLLALLTSAAALSFSAPLRAARAQDAIAQLREFDQSARRAAIASGRAVRMVFDLSDASLLRRDGPQLDQRRAQTALPHGFRVDEVRIGEHRESVGEALVDISPLGLSRTYALHVVGSSFDQWLLVAGMSGEVKAISDEAEISIIFEAIDGSHPPRHDTD